MRVSSALEAGTVSGIFTRALLVSSVPMDLFSIQQVWVNQYNMLNNNVPFGGKKQSGIGMYFSTFQYSFPKHWQWRDGERVFFCLVGSRNISQAENWAAMPLKSILP